MTEHCPICAKHRGEGDLVGPVVWRDDLVVVSHLPVDETGRVVSGYLFVESVRHAPFLDDLRPDEVDAVARAVWCATRALRSELHPDHVFSLVAGRGVAHFHQHVFVRHAGTPEGMPLLARWSEGPHLTAAEAGELSERLRGYFSPR